MSVVLRLAVLLALVSPPAWAQVADPDAPPPPRGCNHGPSPVA